MIGQTLTTIRLTKCNVMKEYVYHHSHTFYVELFIELNKDFPSLAGDLRDQPTTVLQSLGLAVSQVTLNSSPTFEWIRLCKIMMT